MFEVVDSPLLNYLLVAVVLGGSGVVLWAIDVPIHRVRDRLSERFIGGVPWGTLVVVLWLFVVYFVIQRGYWHPSRPVITAYTATSMFDPTGWLLAGFAHTSPGHLRGNITSTLVFAPIVEYVWSHYPRRSRRGILPRRTERPVIRAIVLFPLGIIAIGIVAALFSWGPVIGFSVAVYALIGCALVHYPVLTLVGIVARSTVRQFWRLVTDPVVITETSVRAVRPSWYGTAVQGHLVGLLLGVGIGLYLFRTIDRRPDPGLLWIATLIAAVGLSVYEVWWILGPERFVLFRAAGLAVVVLVATLVALAVTHPRPIERLPAVDLGRAATTILIIAVLGMGVVGIGLNLAVVEAPDEPVAVSVEDYDVYYGENVPDGMVNVVEIEALGLTTDVRTSGVIVVSEDRNVWRQPVSATELETSGSERFTVGGLGWSEELHVIRQGWVPVGNSSVYQVGISEDDHYVQAYASDARTARPIVDGYRFTVGIEEASFYLEAESLTTTERVAIPPPGGTTAVEGMLVHNHDRALIVESGNTTVTVAQWETYR